MHSLWTFVDILKTEYRYKEQVTRYSITSKNIIKRRLYFLSSTLFWIQHITAIIRKVNIMVAILQRKLWTCPKDIKATCTCYKTIIVQPKLQFSVSAWDPSTKSKINMLEAVQHHAARFCHSDCRHTSSVTAMMEGRLGTSTVDPCYLDLAYLKKPLISK